MNDRVRDILMLARPYLVFPPLLVAMLTWVAATGTVGPIAAAICLSAGLFTWTLMEWSLHRLMHVDVKARALNWLQFKAHLRHHAHPRDLPRSIARLRVTIPVTIFILGTSYLTLGTLELAMLFTSGVMMGYLAYETTHLIAHLRWKIPVLSALSKYHLRHHFGNNQRGFGVTSPLWDWVFGTLPKRRKSRQI